MGGTSFPKHPAGAATSEDVIISGSVDYWGNPRVTQAVSGSGRVRKAGE
jgi:hypothetical protein